jgi:hypothetical protein
MTWWYLTSLLAANLVLLLPPASAGRVVGALLLAGFLPGLSWAGRLLPSSPPLLRWTSAAALSYIFASLAGLLLHYLPGPVQLWHILTVLNLLAVLPLLIRKRHKPVEKAGPTPSFKSVCPLALCLIIAVAALLRVGNLHYSEFQGDEALAMISAAEALAGHENALLLRAKGPDEVLLPLILWPLTGTINETIARLPFTLAALWAIITIYLTGHQLGGRRLGWLAAGFFAFNGFMVAFGRIVQYQALVIWFSSLAFLYTLQWRQTGQARFALLGGLSLGTGLLAHYDAILAAPAVGWLLLGPRPNESTTQLASPFAMRTFIAVSVRLIRTRLKPMLLFMAAFLLTSLPFYLPFLLDPQANRTGAYVGQRIGTELRNNLSDFFHFTTFYSSFYYLILTGLLILAFLGWLIWLADSKIRWLAILLPVAVLTVALFPNLLSPASIDLSGLPFLLLFLAALLTFPAGSDRADFRVQGQALVAWLAVPFLGYNFVVALGLTHIYTTVPAWSLLAALGWHYFFDPRQQSISEQRPNCCPLPGQISTGLLVGLLLLSILFLWNGFIRHDVEYWQDYPDGNLSLYWTPFDQPPPAGFFGFAHRAGWKAVGQKIVTGELRGDYGSNEEPDVTTWYSRGAPRACDPRPEFYFIAGDLIDPVEVPTDTIASDYRQIGSVTLPNQKQMQIMQQIPTTLTLGNLDGTVLSRAFDRTAFPAAFARSGRGAVLTQVNFSNLVQLIGYDLDAHRAYPGGRVPVTLYWRTLAPIPASYHVFAHLEGSAGPAAQADGVPVCWSYPTDLWRPGQIIADQHAIPIPSDTPPGRYPLQVGLYLPDTLARLDILDVAGNPAGVSFTIADVEIRERE